MEYFSVDANLPRYPVDRWSGRFWNFWDVCHPRNMIALDIDFENARLQLQEFEVDKKLFELDPSLDTKLRGLTERQAVEEVEGLWRAKALLDSCYLIDTKAPITDPARLCSQCIMCTISFVLSDRVNSFANKATLVFAGMLKFQRSLFAIMFWQGAFQGLSALVTYGHRNGSCDAAIREEELW